ncbi:MAG: hypothetical protein ACRDYB_16395 [Acidimicrobiales bacterium]
MAMRTPKTLGIVIVGAPERIATACDPFALFVSIVYPRALHSATTASGVADRRLDRNSASARWALGRS